MHDTARESLHKTRKLKNICFDPTDDAELTRITKPRLGQP